MSDAFDTATRAKLVKLMRMLGSDQSGESANAWHAIDHILREKGRNWNDLPDLIGGETTADMNAAAAWSDVDEDTSNHEQDVEPSALLDLVLCALREHVEMEGHEYLVVALWAMHTYIFDRYAVPPRLALVSPVRGCGKTTLLDLLAGVCQHGRKFDSASAPALFRMIEATHPTLLLDEVDTQNLGSQGTLRAVLNGGHHHRGRIARSGRGISGQQELHEFSTFAPVALATIGVDTLPLPLQHRSVIIQMRRADGEREIRRLDDTSEAALVTLGRHIGRWARTATLERNPATPPELKNRAADNWRPLIGVADACGRDWGLRAREAAIAMSGQHADEDFGVTLLQDIRNAFAREGVDRISSRDLAAALIELDDAPWSEWRGLHSNQQQRPLSQAQLAQLLRPFDIRPRSMWRGQRPQGSKSAKGYHRSQFEAAWRSYCSPPNDRSAPRLLKMFNR
jgi:hypothetical protein